MNTSYEIYTSITNRVLLLSIQAIKRRGKGICVESPSSQKMWEPQYPQIDAHACSVTFEEGVGVYRFSNVQCL